MILLQNLNVLHPEKLKLDYIANLAIANVLHFLFQLFFPEKVDIPERYMPDSDDESITEEEKAQRQEKANKIKRMLTQQR